MFNLSFASRIHGMELGIGLIGCGAIGTVIAKAVEAGEAGKARIVWLYDLDRRKAELLAKQLLSRPRMARNLTEILDDSDVNLVIEVASQQAVAQYATNILKSGKDLMIMSVGALANRRLQENIRKTAEKTGRRVYVPSGAILGIDGVKAATLGGVDEVFLTTRKPPRALAHSPHVREHGINLTGLRQPVVIFEGSAEEAVKAFPKSVNVAATLSLAGIGFRRTKVRIVADPSIKHNVHEILMCGKAGEFVTKACNVPSPDNPQSSYLAALSAIITLHNLTKVIRIGT